MQELIVGDGRSNLQLNSKRIVNQLPSAKYLQTFQPLHRPSSNTVQSHLKINTFLSNNANGNNGLRTLFF